MTPNANIDENLFRSYGITFLPSFHGGAVGIIARYDLPKLYYPATFSETQIEAFMDKLNSNLRKTYKGCGYYASCPMEDGFNDEHVFVLFADEVFYEDYRNGSAY